MRCGALKRFIPNFLKATIVAGLVMQAPSARALKESDNKAMIGVWLDQKEVVRLPNINAQVAMLAIVSDVNVSISTHWPYQRESDRLEPDAKERQVWLPTYVIPAADGRMRVQVGFMLWIGGGMLKPQGRLDGFGSFAPDTIPVQIHWDFLDRNPNPQSSNSFFYNDPNKPNRLVFKGEMKLIQRRYIEFQLPITQQIQATRTELTFVINGHELRPIPIEFSGKPLNIAQYKYDGPGRLIWKQGGMLMNGNPGESRASGRFLKFD